MDESFRNLGTGVWVSYTEGEWSGTLASAVISIAGSEQATEAHVALIKSSENFFIRGAQWEGIMGMAYSALAKVLLELYRFARNYNANAWDMIMNYQL